MNTSAPEISSTDPFAGLTLSQRLYFEGQQQHLAQVSSRLDEALIHLNSLNNKSELSRSSKIKCNLPETFHGTRSKLPSFISALRIYISMNSIQFTTEKSKVLFAISFLKDAAFSWVEPFVRNAMDPTVAEEESFFNNFEEFLAELQLTFGDIDRKAKAERDIQFVRQKTSVSLYATEFQQIASHLDWNEPALVFQFYKGLKESVKDEVSRLGRPNTLTEIIETSVRLDNRLYERNLERKPQSTTHANVRNHSSRHQKASHHNSNYHGPKPMDIDAISTPTTQRHRGPLSAQERLHRTRNNLCMFCGKPGHRVADCFLAAKKATSSSSNLASISATSSDEPQSSSRPALTFGIQNAPSTFKAIMASQNIKSSSNVPKKGQATQ